MKAMSGNILDIKSGIICQQVNSKYVMGAGLALAIARKWPVVKRVYQEERPPLGICQIVNVDYGLYVGNFVAQPTYSRTGIHTSYPALAQAMQSLHEGLELGFNNHNVYIPFGMGCGLAGGDWQVVVKLIEKHLPQAIIVKLGA